MKKCFIYVIAAISALVVSCNKEIDTPDNNTVKVDQNLVSMTFKAALEGDDTKTTLDISNGKVAWAAGDAVKFVWEVNGTSGVGSSVSTALTAGDIDGDGATSFNASVPETFSKATDASVTSRHLYAVYPSDVVVDYSTASSFYLTVPTEQDGTFAKASIAVAKWDKANVNADLVFNNLCGLLQIVIDDANVRKIVLHSDDYIAGKMDISFTGPSVKGVNSGENDITVNVSGAGTYYVAVLPTDSAKGIGVTNMYVSLYNESGALIGDKTTTNELTVARKQIRKLGTIATDAVERFFVKAAAEGTGDGSSWDNAADYAALQTKLTGNGTCKIYMSAETYSSVTVTEILASGTSSNYEIVGGFPTTNKGCDLSGRTIGGTILDGSSSNRVLILRAGAVTFDGITMQNCSSGSSGGAIFVEKTGALKCKNCTFTNNTCNVNGGAIIFSAISTSNCSFTNCIFSSNTTPSTSNVNTGLGSAVSSTGSSANATVSFNKCLFYRNNSYRGGAVHLRACNFTLTDCNFIDNYSSTTGGAIFFDGTNARYIYMDRCYFTYTGESYVGSGATIRVSNSNGKWGMNNCLISGSWGDGAIPQVNNIGTGVIVNSTLFGQRRGDGIVTNAGTLCVINSIVPNAADSGTWTSFTNSGTITLDHTLYYSINNTGTFNDQSNNLPKVKTTKSDNTPNFPVVSESYGNWYVGSYDAQYTNNQTSSSPVPDVRETVHYYKWNGTINPIDEVSFTKATPAQVTSAVTTAYSAFATWLGSGLTSIDIRGNARNTAAMWPGSYEE